MGTTESESSIWQLHASAWFLQAMIWLAMNFGSTLPFSQLSLGERLNPWIHRSAPCHKSTAGLCENHTWPQKACGEQPSNSPECCAVYSVQTGGIKCLTSRHNSSQKGRGELGNSACSSWTLYFPSMNTEINLGLVTKALPWRDILPCYFMAKQKLLQEIQGLAAEFFSPRPVQCEPICFSPHNSRLSLFPPTHPTPFLLSGSLSLFAIPKAR